MPEPKPIGKAKQLLVEGRDAESFCVVLLKTLQLADIQVQNFGGVNELQSFLKAFVKARKFGTEVRSLGIMRDADSNPMAAFQSVCSALQNVGLNVPTQMDVAIGHAPRVSVFILPNADKPGMLETICLEAVADRPIVKCIEEYFACVQKTVGALPANLDKARVHAFLSSMARPHLTFGQSAEAGYWPFDNPVFDPLKKFLIAL